MHRAGVDQLETGAVLENAVRYQLVAQTMDIPHDNRRECRRTLAPGHRAPPFLPR